VVQKLTAGHTAIVPHAVTKYATVQLVQHNRSLQQLRKEETKYGDM
jgi:hypothetical protein|tara:strand:- start:874 stop:1011 length:138 start_codon:yes stop_codon:yes gene_type:complete